MNYFRQRHRERSFALSEVTSQRPPRLREKQQMNYFTQRRRERRVSQRRCVSARNR